MIFDDPIMYNHNFIITYVRMSVLHGGLPMSGPASMSDANAPQSNSTPLATPLTHVPYLLLYDALGSSQRLELLTQLSRILGTLPL
jgi:hypothetical protein